MPAYWISHESAEGTEFGCTEARTAVEINAAVVKLAFDAPFTDGDVIKITKQLTEWDIRQQAARMRAAINGIEE